MIWSYFFPTTCMRLINCAYVSLLYLDNSWWLLLKWTLQRTDRNMVHWTLIQNTLWKFYTAEVHSEPYSVFVLIYIMPWLLFKCDIWFFFHCFCSLLSAYRGKINYQTYYFIYLSCSFRYNWIYIVACSIVSTCLSQPNVDNGLRRTFLMFLPGWL